MQTLHPQTRDNLARATRREAFAFASFLLYATQARRHGRPQVAELFEQVANQEYFGHFVAQAPEAGLIGMEAENLHLAIEKEAFEAEVMYRDFQAQAETVGDHGAVERFGRLCEDERRNRDRFWPSCGPWTRPTRLSSTRGDRAMRIARRGIERSERLRTIHAE